MKTSAVKISSVENAKKFTQEHITPYAETWDREEKVPDDFIKLLANTGLLGASIPEAYGGLGLSQVEYGKITTVIGEACSSVRSLLTVHTSLSAETILKWGTPSQKESLLPKLCSGELLSAFALSEPQTGSDAKNVQSTYTINGDYFVLNGHKKWTTFGQIANQFITIFNGEKGVTAFIVNANTPGVKVKPIKGMMGTRASLLAEIIFEDCRIHHDTMLGRQGFGFMQIVNTALDNGRYSVACGCVGIAKAATVAAIAHAKNRIQFGEPIKNHHLIQQKISQMATKTSAAQQLCLKAGEMRDENNPDAIIKTSMAKYFASMQAQENATDCVQIHGASGCLESHPAQRLYRDAKVMEIIEGSTQMQELLIADYAIRNLTSLID